VLFDDEKCIFINEKLSIPLDRQVAMGTMKNRLYIYKLENMIFSIDSNNYGIT